MKFHFKRLIGLSILCLFFTAVSNANLGIISQFASQNHNDWIGSVSIALLFLGSGVGSLYSKYINKYRYNRVIFAGAVGWDIFIAFSVIFLYIGFSDYVIGIIIVGSLFCGMIVSVYYNGTFNYINQSGKRDKCVQTYFGLNLCFNQTSNVVGNTLSRFLIEPLGQKVYSLVMMGIGIAVSFCFLLLKQFNSNQQMNSSLTRLQNNDKSLIQDETLEEQKQKSQVQITYNQPKHPYSIISCYVMSGVLISFVFGQFSILFYKYYKDLNKQELNKLTFTAFIIQGAGQFAGGLFLALFSKYIKRISLLFSLNGLVFLGSIALMYAGFQQDNKSVIYAGSFFLGWADVVIFSTALSLAGRWNQLGISLFNIGQSGTVAILSTLHIFIELQFLAIIYVVVFILSSLSLCLNNLSKNQISNQNKINDK